MKYELLNYLKSYNNANLIRYFYKEYDGDRDLERLTNFRLKEIASFIDLHGQKPQIMIIEADPVEFLAVFLAGVIAEVDLFLCDPNWQQREWQQVLQLVKPDLIYGRDISDFANFRSGVERIDSKSKLLETSSTIMIPTGGTSGKIRFAIHNWQTLSASVRGFQDYFNCQNINSFCTLPLYHVSGLMQFMRSFLTGGNLMLCPYKTVKTKRIESDYHDYFISLVPTQLEQLIEFVPGWLSEFKTVLVGGAPSRRSLLDTARKYNISVALTYGMTETASGVVALKSKEFLAGNSSSGKVLPHAKITINSLDRKIGLIEISCASLCLGYYPSVFNSDRPFMTDDLGYFDRDGYLHLVGRNSHKIITGGENVFPAEVESAIYSTNLVQDICVIGISDRQWGQAVTAIYVPVEFNFDLDLLVQQVRRQLAKYKQPKNWIRVDRIPRNNRGKIDYQKLKAIAQKNR